MANSSQTESSKVVLGRLGKVYGIKGWLKLNSFTSPPENILDFTDLLAEIEHRWQALEIDEYRQQANGLLVHIKGYDDPETARQLTGVELAVDSNTMPALEQGSYYWFELQGMQVLSQQGENFGIVAGLLETGANDVLVVTPTKQSIDERERLIPYIAGSVIQKVDTETQTIRVNWETDYLE